MKKLTFLVVAVLFAGTLLMAQTVQDAKKFMYYGRYTSAKQALDKLVAADPKNAESIYWLGQWHLMQRPADVAAAKSVYQNALQGGLNDPLIWVGMGHVELLEGKNNEARQRFEAAITATSKKKRREMVEDPQILNAIGRANADGDSKTGDPQYAIEKLKKATEIEPTNPETFVNLGINHLKVGNGGDAFEAFRNALRVDPNYALANLRLGKIFQSQRNREQAEQYFNSAITGDPAFAPAYLELYDYYANRDVNKAREYLDKFIANADKDCSTEFFYADYLFRSGNYKESLDRAKAMEAGACSTYPRLKVLYAYNHDRLGNSEEAKNNIEGFLNNANAVNIQPTDYEFAASVLKNIPGSEQNAITYLERALEADTNRNTRFKYMDTIAFLYRKQGKYPERLQWLQKSYETNPNPSNLDIYNLGDAAVSAGNFDLADTMFNRYKREYPDQIYGYLGLSKSAIARDKDTTAGSAVPAVMDYINFMTKADPARYKAYIIQNYGYLVYVHANVQKDYEAALRDLEGILAVDPENAYAKGTAEQIRRVMKPGSK